MNSFVTWNAQGDAIRKFECEIRMRRKVFNVVSVKLALIAAVLASVAVSFIDRGSPSFQFTFVFAACVGIAAFPTRMILAAFEQGRTLERAELLPFIEGGKMFMALWTDAFFGFGRTNRPAGFRAIPSAFRTVEFNKIRGATKDARFGDAGVGHAVVDLTAFLLPATAPRLIGARSRRDRMNAASDLKPAASLLAVNSAFSSAVKMILKRVRFVGILHHEAGPSAVKGGAFKLFGGGFDRFLFVAGGYINVFKKVAQSSLYAVGVEFVVAVVRVCHFGFLSTFKILNEVLSPCQGKNAKKLKYFFWHELIEEAEAARG